MTYLNMPTLDPHYLPPLIIIKEKGNKIVLDIEEMLGVKMVEKCMWIIHTNQVHKYTKINRAEFETIWSVPITQYKPFMWLWEVIDKRIYKIGGRERQVEEENATYDAP